MKVLAADTGTAYAAIAVCDGDTILAETSVRLDRRHAESLLTLTDTTLKQAGLALNDIDLLAIAHGPGSFTGLRIGVSSWKGLALGAHKPLIGVPTLDAMARNLPDEGATICPMIDARMGEVFTAAYRWENGERRTIHEAHVGSAADFIRELPGPVTVYGDGAHVYADAIRQARGDVALGPADAGIPSGVSVAAEALSLAAMGAPADGARVEPVYLRKSQAEQMREGVA